MLRAQALARSLLLILIAIVVVSIIALTRALGHTSTQTLIASASSTFPLNHGNWVVGPAVPANVWMHWQELQYIGTTAVQGTPSPTTEPAVNMVLTIDHWVQTDGTGKTVFVRMTSRSSDGTLFEDDYDSSTMSVTVQGSVYASTFGNTQVPNWCYGQTKPPRPLSVVQFPYYLDSNQMQSDHFTKTTNTLSKPLPPSDPESASLVSSTTIDIPSKIWSWEGQSSPDAAKGFERIRFDTDGSGRIVVFDLKHYTPAGDFFSEQWYSIGKISIYPAFVQVPADVVAPPVQITKGCNA